MEKDEISSKWHQQRIEVFKSQDIEKGFFDVVFEVEGKAIHAHKFLLATISTPLQAVFSQQIPTKQEPIKISNYIYDDFFQLLLFIYSGSCELNEENIISMIEMSNAYDVPDLLKQCDSFIKTGIEFKSTTNIFDFYERLYRYDLPSFKETVYQYIFKNIALMDSEEFMNLEKETLEAFVSTFDGLKVFAEEVFTAIFRWADNRATEKKNSSKKRKNFDYFGVVKNELKDILPHFQFADMNKKFLDEFVVRRGYLFTYEELSDILVAANKSRVEVSNEDGQQMYGRMLNNDDVIYAIEQLQSPEVENSQCDTNFVGCFWFTNVSKKKLDISSNLIKKKDGIDYYLVINSAGDICVKNQQNINDDEDFLLAEMTTVFDFKFNKSWLQELR